MQVKQTCVLGSGICGLVSGWKAQQDEKEVTVIDSANRAGGVIESAESDGFLMDYGPNTLSLRLRNTEDVLRQTGALDHAIDANPEANKRFIVRKGKLVALPNGFASFLTNPFLSFSGKLRVLLEPFLAKGKDRKNESVAGFISRRLGKEALDYLANPFLAGIYAAKPETLCMRHTFPAIHELEEKHRSLLLGKIFGSSKSDRLTESRLISFPSGMSELTDRIETSIKGDFIFNHKVTKVAGENGKWRVFACDSNGNEWNNSFDEVVCTLPAHQLAKVSWQNVARSENLSLLQKASHFPLSVVFLGFEEKAVSHPLDGFGFLVPEAENLNILGSLFSSTLFPGRAPTGKVLLTTFVGGERNPELALSDEETLYGKVTEEVSSLLGIRGQPVFRHIKTWKEAIPLPDIGFDERKKAMNTLQETNPGLLFSGSHLTGPPLPNCLDSR